RLEGDVRLRLAGRRVLRDDVRVVGEAGLTDELHRVRLGTAPAQQITDVQATTTRADDARDPIQHDQVACRRLVAGDGRVHFHAERTVATGDELGQLVLVLQHLLTHGLR